MKKLGILVLLLSVFFVSCRYPNPEQSYQSQVTLPEHNESGVPQYYGTVHIFGYSPIKVISVYCYVMNGAVVSYKYITTDNEEIRLSVAVPFQTDLPIEVIRLGNNEL